MALCLGEQFRVYADVVLPKLFVLLWSQPMARARSCSSSREKIRCHLPCTKGLSRWMNCHRSECREWGYFDGWGRSEVSAQGWIDRPWGGLLSLILALSLWRLVVHFPCETPDRLCRISPSPSFFPEWSHPNSEWESISVVSFSLLRRRMASWRAT